jgi:serpin B
MPQFTLPRSATPFLIAAILGLTGTLSSIAMSKPSPQPAQPATPDTAAPATIDTASAVADHNTFAADLFRTAAAQTTGNIALSPWNVSTALQIARAGSKGVTRDEMTAALRQSPATSPEASAALRRKVLSQTAAANSPFTLVESNRLWCNPIFQTLETYRTQIATNYNAQAEILDFTNPAAASKTINTAVAKSTNNLITKLIDETALARDTSAVITSTVYFNALWRHRFDPNDTTPQKFFLTPEKTVDHAMMTQTSRLEYAEIQNATVASMTYQGAGGTDAARAIFVLPAPGKIDQVIASLNIAATRQALRPELVQLHLPKLDISSSMSLKPTLLSMGMKAPFSASDADFSLATTARPNNITNIVHAVRIKADENRTEAAAATGIDKVGAPPSREPPKIYEVRLDRPFILIITEESTNATLFIARINDPR